MNNVKVPSNNNIKLFDQDNKEIKTLDDFNMTMTNSMGNESIQIMGN